MPETIPTDAICVRCKTTKTHQVPLERVRQDSKLIDPWKLSSENFLSFEAECVCADEETWHNVVGVHRGLINADSDD